MAITKADANTYVAVEHEEYFGPIVEIGKFTSVGEKVIFCGSMNHVWVNHREAVATFNFRERWHEEYFDSGGVSRGPITIGSDVWICRGVTIMDGITIGDGAVIGMHAVVAKDVPPYGVAVGNPARVHHYRFPKEIREKLLKIKWWDWSKETIIERMADFRDVKVFVEKYYGK